MKELNYHFETETFLSKWEEWKEWKRLEKKGKYNSIKGEQSALSHLFNISNGIESVAVAIIDFSKGCGYRGLFPLPKNMMPHLSINTNANSKILTTLSAAEQAKIEMRNELGFN